MSNCLVSAPYKCDQGHCMALSSCYTYMEHAVGSRKSGHAGWIGDLDMRLLIVVTLTLLVAFSMGCSRSATKTPPPTAVTTEPGILSHELKVIADPQQAASFLFNPDPVGRSLFVHGRTVTIDVLPKSGLETNSIPVPAARLGRPDRPWDRSSGVAANSTVNEASPTVTVATSEEFDSVVGLVPPSGEPPPHAKLIPSTSSKLKRVRGRPRVASSN